ncbi:MAG: VF530 family protein [Marinoscillum sp.]|uniref:VF530 family protein n=2 Tax=Marinoscillum sp. TaxID=2024838 RepID=UPI0032F28511
MHRREGFKQYFYTMEQPKENQPNNPLHGIKLVTILEHLQDKYGWEELGSRIRIKCFTDNPSIKSSLTFLRKTPWARTKVEELYLRSIRKK